MFITMELVNLAEITIMANLFLKKNRLVEGIVHEFEKYIYRFVFLDCEESTINGWVKKLKDKDVEDIYIDFNPNIDLFKVAFCVPAGLVCKYKNGNVTFWVKRWQYDKNEKRYYVTYQERESVKEMYNNGFVDRFENNFQYFKNSVKQVEKIAEILELQFWKDYFNKVFELENIEKARECPVSCDLYNVIPDKNLCVYAMAAHAFPFGMMGSWNDAPYGMAISREMEEKFVKESQNLFAELMCMLCYATNTV